MTPEETYEHFQWHINSTTEQCAGCRTLISEAAAAIEEWKRRANEAEERYIKAYRERDDADARSAQHE